MDIQSLKALKMAKLNDLLFKYAGVNPSGSYSDLTSLQNAFPTGNKNIYLISGNWYYWNEQSWVKGGSTIQSVNLFNLNTSTPNQYVFGGSTGNVGVNGSYSNGYYASDWIPVKPNTNYIWTTMKNGLWAVYDSNKNYITGYNSGSNIYNSPYYTTPSNAAYMRISTVLTSEMFIEGTVLPSSFVPYSTTLLLPNGKNLSSQVIDNINKTLKSVPKLYTANMFNKATISSPNQYVFGNSDGHVGSNSTYSNGYYASDYIPVLPNTSYVWTTKGFWAIYDSNKNFISGQGATSPTNTTVTPNNAGYMRISTQNPSAEMFVQGSSLPPAYASYGYSLKSDDGVSVLSSYTTKWNGRNILAIGDSLTAALKWQNAVQTFHGCSITTHALGGIAFVDMVDGVTNTNGTIAALTVADVTGKDLIILFGGMNERSTTYGVLGDVYPTNNTLYGRMQYVINKIYNLLQQANNLTCKILMVAPHCCGKYGYIDADGYMEYPSGSGQTLEKLVNNIVTCGNYNNLRVVDLWHKSGVGKNTWNVYMASSTPTLATPNASQPYPNNADQVHFNDTGYAMIGGIIAGEMNLI